MDAQALVTSVQQAAAAAAEAAQALREANASRSGGFVPRNLDIQYLRKIMLDGLTLRLHSNSGCALLMTSIQLT